MGADRISLEVRDSMEADVAVIGAGSAGVAAAIACGRQGLKTILLEKTELVGGVPVTSAMGSFANLFINSSMEQLVSGIPMDILRRTVSKGGSWCSSLEEVVKGRLGEPFSIPFQPEIYSLALIELLEEAGVICILDADFVKAEGSPRMEAVYFTHGAGITRVRAKVFIDATGNADVARSAGAPTESKPSSHGCLMRAGGVNIQETLEYLNREQPWQADDAFCTWLRDELNAVPEDNKPLGYASRFLDPMIYSHMPQDTPEDVNFSPEKMAYINKRWNREGVVYTLELQLFRHLIRKAVSEGKFVFDMVQAPGKGISFNCDGVAYGGWGDGVALFNIAKPYGFDPSDVREETAAILGARKYNLMIFVFFKKYVPGFEAAYMIDMGSAAVSRHCRTIDGLARGAMPYEPDREYEMHPVWEHPIYIFGGMYAHAPGKYIPYGAIVPRKVENLLTVGKCASGAERYRSQISCMSMGVAAGAAAGVMIRENSAAGSIPAGALRESLEGQGVLLRRKSV